MLKVFVKSIKNYLPTFLKKKVDEKVLNNKLKKHRERKKRVFVKLQEVEDILNKFDFNSDIIIHSSTSNIGKIEGGGIAITDLIVSKIDLSKNTLLAPALPFLGSVKDYIESLTSFDLQNAKNAMGNISNMIMKKEGCQRSFHPTHSVIALGKNAKFYAENHETCKTPFAEQSPYYKITKNNGKILMFGVNLNSITNFHVYEDILGDFLPFKVYTKDEYIIKSTNGNLNQNIIVRAHNPKQSAKRDCERARKFLIENNYIETYSLGDSEVSMLDAKGLTITLLQMLQSGHSIYGKVKLSKKQKLKIEETLNLLS